jgi:hypothetical protein
MSHLWAGLRPGSAARLSPGVACHIPFPPRRSPLSTFVCWRWLDSENDQHIVPIDRFLGEDAKESPRSPLVGSRADACASIVPTGE